MEPLKIGQVVVEGTRYIALEKNSVTTFGYSSKASSTLELISNYEGKTFSEKVSLFLNDDTRQELTSPAQESIKWLPCIDAPEVWAVGVTYKRQAKEHDDDIKQTTSKTDDLYTFVYENERAEVFFKGFNRTVSAHDEPVNLRADSNLVLPEAESVLVLGKDSSLLGFTYGNDLTAWDLEKECPLYLNQAKIWNGSASVGQWIIPLETINDPYDFTLKCEVIRNGEKVIDSTGSTKDLKRSYEELIHYLKFNNSVPTGTLLFTGTACIIPHDFSLQEGDIVSVEKVNFGRMTNTVKRLDTPTKHYTTRN
jgi:2-dehydro-3-deoxy-D-arabinonate dehydratase